MRNLLHIAIADDHDIVRRGLEVSINAFGDMEVVGQAANGLDTISLCKVQRPDILLLDLKLPDMKGIDVIRELKTYNLPTKIIALTSYKESALVHDVLEAGATSYLLKNVTINQLVCAIRDAYAGNPTLAPEVTKALIKHVTQPRPDDFNLTEREVDVLTLLTDGLSNPEIASRLVISRSTVKNHVSNIITKLNVSGRTEAATKALKLRLITLA